MSRNPAYNKLKEELVKEKKENIKKKNEEFIAEQNNNLTDENFTRELHEAYRVDLLTFAEKFIRRQPIYFDSSKIWWVWEEKNYRWKILDETDILICIKKMCREIDTVSGKRGSILESLRQVGRDHKPKEAERTWIQFKDTIVDVISGEKRKATAEYFITNPVPWKLGTSEETPNIDKLFEDWVGKEYVQTLYEIIAYCMLMDYPYSRLFCFIGSGRNGKSTFLELLTKTIGVTNCTSSSLELLLGNRFESAKLYKKLICQMGETNFKMMENTDTLKKLTGRDLMGFEIKNKDPFEDYNYAKIIISTNSLPATTDRTDGFYRRWLILDFKNNFTEQNGILDHIKPEEYENLCLKCFRLLKTLLTKPGEEKFTGEGSIKERMEAFEAKSDPMQKFIDDECLMEGEIPKFLFRDNFMAFCKQNGLRIWSDPEISKYMKNKGHDQIKKRTLYAENPVWCWSGITFKEKNVPTVPEVPGISLTTTTRENLSENCGTFGTLGTDLCVEHKKIHPKCLKCVQMCINTFRNSSNGNKGQVDQFFDSEFIQNLLTNGEIVKINDNTYECV